MNVLYRGAYIAGASITEALDIVLGFLGTLGLVLTTTLFGLRRCLTFFFGPTMGAFTALTALLPTIFLILSVLSKLLTSNYAPIIKYVRTVQVKIPNCSNT